jgi:hypothetical protein
VSWQASAWALEMGKRYELPMAPRFLLIALANYANEKGENAFPSNATLQGDTGMSEMSIRRHLKHLIECGLIEYGDQSAAARAIDRSDRLPKVYRLCMVPVDNSPNGVPKRGTKLNKPQATGYQMNTERGTKRGTTVVPKLKEPLKENLCSGCDRMRPVDAMADSGLCSDCIGHGSTDIQAGIAYREQLRLKRLAKTVGKMP